MAHGMDTSYKFSILPGVGHDFTLAMKNGQMGQQIFKYLYGDAKPQTPSTIADAPRIGLVLPAIDEAV